MSKLSCSVNEQIFKCENIKGADKSKCYLSTEMTSSSDLCVTNDQISKSVETSESLNTRNETVNSQYWPKKLLINLPAIT